MPSNLCHPLFLLPSIFSSIRVFSNESALHIRWSKYWSFSFSISPSNEYAGLISFRIDWFNRVPDKTVQVSESVKSIYFKNICGSTSEAHSSRHPLLKGNYYSDF